VRFEMVDRDKWLARGPCDPLRGHGADDQTADQARAYGSRYAIDLGQCDVSFGKGTVNDVIEVIEVGPRRDLRHNSTKRRMLDLLPVNHI